MINPKKKKRSYLDYDLEGYIKGQQTARIDATSNQQATTQRQVAENNTSEKVQQRRVANERRKTQEAYDKGKRDYEKQQQAAKIQEDIESRPWWNPTAVLRNAKNIPIFGAAPTVTEWAYGLMNKAVGNDVAGDYYMQDADNSATGQAIALAAIPAHTNPYTAAIYDTALLAPWAKELDAQGKFYHPENLTGEEAAMLGLSFLPFGMKYRPQLSYAKTAAEDAALQSSIPWVRDNARGLYLSRAINQAAGQGVQAPIKVNRSIERDGTIRMSLPSHTSEQPRQFVIDPQGNNKYYIHMRTWDGKKVPANLSAAEKNALFESVYNELPEGAEILFPKSSEDYLATRGTVAGLQRLSRDKRFSPGQEGTLLYYDDKTGQIKTYTGTSFIKNPQQSATQYVIENSEPVNVPTTISWNDAVSLPVKITEENAAAITPEQWTAAQDAALARGDMIEAQRLRDLHFKVNAPNTQLPGNYYRSERGDKLWNIFDMLRAGANGSRIGKGIYFFNDANAVKNYGNDIRRFYVNSNKVVEDIPGPKLFGMPESTISKFKNHRIPALRKAAENIEGADAVHGIDESWGKPLDEWVVKNPNQIKLADAVTYDNNGIRVPLGERDNFTKNDIRYGIIPWLLGVGTTAGAAYGASQQDNNQQIQVQKKGGKILPPWHK